MRCDRLVVADGVRSPLGRVLGRKWHRDTVYGVAARAYLDSGRDDRWISSHLELRGPAGELLSGYGWIFPLGGGQVNLGVGTLATAKRPANISLRPLLEYYAGQRREEWQLGPDVRMPTSALLPMGGAVERCGRTQLGADRRRRGLRQPAERRGNRLRAGDRADWWPTCWSTGPTWVAAGRRCSATHYGPAFSIARRLAGLITVPGLLARLGPIGMRSRLLMTVALRVMGNLVTDADHDLVARVWRLAAASQAVTPGHPSAERRS